MLKLRAEMKNSNNIFPGSFVQISLDLGVEKNAFMVPAESIIPILKGQKVYLVRDGKVLYVGSSNFAGWHIAHAQSVAVSRQFMGLASEQSLYNLKDRMIELEVIPACTNYGLGIIPWSPLAGGLLGGALQKVSEGRRISEQTQKNIEKYRPQLQQYEALCSEIVEKPADIAISWLLNNPAITAPIIGPRTMDQLTEILHAFEIKLTDDILARLDQIWPGPGGPAPEAYAW